MTYQESKQHLARKLNIDYADIANNDLFNDTDLGVLIQLGVQKAWDYKPWDFTEGAKEATTLDTAYYDYPQDYQSGSGYLVTVAGKEYKKLLFQDYLKFKEDFPDGANRFWSEHKRFVFINQNAYSVGDTYCIFGKLMPPVLSSSSDILPFSPDTDNYEHSGNEAIVQLAYAEALDSEKLKNPTQAETERKKAYQTLDILWKPFAEQRALSQSNNRPFFNVPDFFGGRANNKSSEFNGNFNYLN